jgi:hypothetical protein
LIVGELLGDVIEGFPSDLLQKHDVCPLLFNNPEQEHARNQYFIILTKDKQ